MRWEELFADLEAASDAQLRRQLDGEVADRVRRERATVGLLHRLAAAGGSLTIEIEDVGPVAGRVLDLGGEGPGGGAAHDGGPTAGAWVLVEDRSGSEVLVPLSAVTWVSGLPRRSHALPLTTRRFGLGLVLRGLARDRAAVVVRLRGGRSLQGTIDAVGLDSFDLAEHAPDAPRRHHEVSAVRAVPLGALVLLRRAR